MLISGRGRPIQANGFWRCAVLVLGLGCLPPPKEPAFSRETTVTSGVPAATLDLAELGWKPGVEEIRWNVGTQGQRSASVWVPEAPRPRSIIIVLHGAVVRGARGPAIDIRVITKHLITCLAAPAFEDLEPLIIAPHSVDGQWWKDVDTEFVLGLATAARQRWPELTSRSVIMGYSNGGIATWYFARLYPQYFSAAIPMAFNDTIVGATPLPIYAIQGAKDELFPIGPVRDAVEALKARGVDVTLAERYRAGHMNACAYEPELAMAARWLDRHAFPKALGAAPPERGGPGP